MDTVIEPIHKGNAPIPISANTARVREHRARAKLRNRTEIAQTKSARGADTHDNRLSSQPSIIDTGGVFDITRPSVYQISFNRRNAKQLKRAAIAAEKPEETRQRRDRDASRRFITRSYRNNVSSTNLLTPDVELCIPSVMYRSWLSDTSAITKPLLFGDGEGNE